MSAGELSRVFVGLTGRAALMCCGGLLSGESRSVREAVGTRAFHNVRARDDQAIVSSGCDPPGLRCPDLASVIFLMLCARTSRAAVKTMVIWVSERFSEIPVPTRNSRGTVGSRRILSRLVLSHGMPIAYSHFNRSKCFTHYSSRSFHQPSLLS